MSIWDDIADFFTEDIGDWLSDVFKGSTAIALGSIKDIALNAVLVLVNTDFSNEEKKKRAFDLIITSAKNEGKETTTGIINLAIEMAVQSLKD